MSPSIGAGSTRRGSPGVRRLFLGLVAALALISCAGASASSPHGLRLGTGALPPGLHSSASATATAIAAGGAHTCALTSAGGVKCWGLNKDGRLGDGTRTERHAPVAVSGLASGVGAIAAGGAHTCALTSAGGVKCWGGNVYGQLGDGTTTMRTTPVAVSGLASGVAAVTARGGHTCALTSAGAVECWGANGVGQLGDGTTATRLTPVAVSDLTSGIQAIDAGSYHTCALTHTGAVACWGYNQSGQLGDGTTTDHHTPVAVSGLASGVAAVAAGDGHTCALTSAGAVECWGADGSDGRPDPGRRL